MSLTVLCLYCFTLEFLIHLLIFCFRKILPPTHSASCGSLLSSHTSGLLLFSETSGCLPLESLCWHHLLWKRSPHPHVHPWSPFSLLGQSLAQGSTLTIHNLRPPHHFHPLIYFHFDYHQHICDILLMASASKFLNKASPLVATHSRICMLARLS